jgi:hypothetical protein
LKNLEKWMQVNGKVIYGAGLSPVVAPNEGEPKASEPAYQLVAEALLNKVYRTWKENSRENLESKK